jgi:NAD(P)H-dependent flavin oxidoreductase YrpB (nitropropane dioxygenase family)
VAAVLSLGAVGVWVGTAFLVADECAIPDASKDQIVNGSSAEFEIGRAFSGKTMRSYNNEIIEAWEASGLAPLPMPHQKILMDGFDEAAARAGRWDLHSNPPVKSRACSSSAGLRGQFSKISSTERSRPSVV